MNIWLSSKSVCCLLFVVYCKLSLFVVYFYMKYFIHLNLIKYEVFGISKFQLNFDVMYGNPSHAYTWQYSQLSLSRLRLSRITAYLEEKILSLFYHRNRKTGYKIL